MDDVLAAEEVGVFDFGEFGKDDHLLIYGVGKLIDGAGDHSPLAAGDLFHLLGNAVVLGAGASASGWYFEGEGVHLRMFN